MLRPLIPSPGTSTISGFSDVARCGFCGGEIGPWSCNEACGLCHLALNLGRPRIDDEALLCWLPEVSQAVVSRIYREMYQRLAGPTASLSTTAARYVDLALAERVDRATEILGTSRPSEFTQALTLLTPAAYAARHRLLGGVRVLPAGRLFVGDTDIFPELVAHCATHQPSLADAE